jgi:hypothetical protein
MALEFHRAIEHMEIWSASSAGFLFVISYESPTGPGLSRARRLCGVVAPRHRERRRGQDRRLAIQNARRSRSSLQYHLKHLTRKTDVKA